MGSYCHLQVSFACDDHEVLAGVAKKHREPLEKKWDEERRIFATERNITGDHPVYDNMVEFHALVYLISLSEDKCVFIGPKGGVCSWGIVGNYVQEEEFVFQLIPFWIDVLSGEEGLACKHEHIIVFYEHQERPSGAFEIYRLPEGDPGYTQRGVLIKGVPPGILVYHHEDLPFRWHQF